MKHVMSLHDIMAIVHDFGKNGLGGMRVKNIYNATNKMICIKLSSNDKEKYTLVIDSGAKIYLENKSFTAIHETPNGFCMKLRKHLKNKRIETVKQIKNDRIIDIQFGINEFAHHIICEFYASGNIILTDQDYKILMVLHKHTYDEDTKVEIGVEYPIDHATMDASIYDIENMRLSCHKWFAKLNFPKRDKLRQIFTNSPIAAYGPFAIMHGLCALGFKPNRKLSLEELQTEFTEDIIDALIIETSSVYNTAIGKGYLLPEVDTVIPMIYKQYETAKYTEYESFNRAVCEYYFKLDNVFEESRAEKKKEEMKEAPVTHTDKTIGNIQTQIDSYDDKIVKQYDTLSFIETYRTQISEVLKNMNNKDARGFYISKKLISHVDYPKTLVTIEIDGFSMEFDWTKTIDANISNKYQKVKSQKKKKEKAEAILDEKQQEKKRDVKKKEKKDVQVDIKGKKKPNWFEEYNWFINSKGYIVVSGKTADQNEAIVSKYLNDNEVYVHSDMPGSGSCVIKTNGDPIDERVIEEAGAFVICHTQCWKQQSPDRTWWVNGDQVSKTPESGEFVTKGSFIIRGKKNMLSYPVLELGLTVIFKTSKGFMTAGNDTTEYALPMVAPYRVVKNNKFKAKILPGKQKVGKALKSVIGKFLSNAEPYEKEAIKQIPNDDIQRVLVTGIKFA
jgi:predicted ribosome quality control (RQC) complex YloA/Tae2 family protein